MGISLIAGGVGFIGYHLCKYLLEKGETVLIVDNFSNSIYENYKKLESYKNVYMYVGNIDKKSFIYDYLDMIEKYNIESIDTIYNLICSSDKTRYSSDALKVLDSCYIGSKNLLELAKRFNAKYIQLSSDEIDELTSKEIEGLRIAELLSIEYHKKYSLNTRILRLPEIYGTNMKSNNSTFIYNAIKQILTTNKCKIPENTSQVLVCSFIENVLEDLEYLKTAENITNSHLPKRMSSIYIYTVPEFFKILQEIHKENIEVIYPFSAFSKSILSDEQTERFKDNLKKIYKDVKNK